MPRATKDAPARPFDVPDAIRRAAKCRALREGAGLTLEMLAAAAGVTIRSVSRWESAEGRGSCPDDVLALLESMHAAQLETVAAAVGAALGGGALDRGRGGIDGAALTGRHGGAGGVNQAVYPEGGEGRFGADPAGGGGRFDARGARAGGALDARGAAKPVSIPYYASQAAFARCHPNLDAYYGVSNANARAIANELERLGFEVEFRYAEPENIGEFEIETIPE